MLGLCGFSFHFSTSMSVLREVRRRHWTLWKWGCGQLGAGVVGAGKQTQAVVWKSCMTFNHGAVTALSTSVLGGQPLLSFVQASP